MHNKLKVIHIIHELGPGGAEKLVVDWVNTCQRLNHNVQLCVYNTKGEYGFFLANVDKKVKVHNLDINFDSPKKFFQVYIKLYRLLKREKPDIVNTHLWALDHIIVFLLASRKTKVFHTIHSLPNKEKGNRINYLFRKLLFKNKLANPIAISDDVYKGIKELYGESPNRLLVKNGVNIPKPSVNFKEVTKEVNNLKFNLDTRVFINVGRLVELKNHELLIKVFKELYQRDINAILIVIGDCPSTEKKKDLNYYRNIAPPNVFFLGKKQNVSDYLLNSDFFCLSSLYEGIGLALLEAMAVKLVPIITPAEGAREVIIDGNNGFISPSFTAYDYCNTILDVLDLDENSLSVLQENALTTYKHNYSMSKCVQNYLKVYSSN